MTFNRETTGASVIPNRTAARRALTPLLDDAVGDAGAMLYLLLGA